MTRREAIALMAAGLGAGAAPADEPPLEWIEPVTRRRVVRLSREPGSGSLYFHQNAFTASGDKMIFTVRGILAVLDWKTREIRKLTDHPVRSPVVGRKSRQAYCFDRETVCAIHLDTGAVKNIGTVPREYAFGSGLTVNADETLLAGTSVEPGAAPPPRPPSSPDIRGRAPRPNLDQIFEQHTPRLIYTLDVASGETKVIKRGTDWYNHIQFSPADPSLIMYCHEGPWHKLDRIWTIRTDGSDVRKIHSRGMDMEIAGHEFWNPDGKIIWFDLQTPKSKEFWLAGVLLATGQKIRYSLEREQWSVHYNVSWDGKLFAGDGGGPRSVAAGGNGQWIYLFTPSNGVLQVERLVDLSKHDYSLEPNVMFTPDGKWIVFRSNMHGASHVYAVEVARSKA